MSLVAPLLPESADAHSAFLAMVKRMRSTGSKSSLRAKAQRHSYRAAPYASNQSSNRPSKQRPCGRTGRAGPVRERASTPSTATDSSVPNTPEHSTRLPLPTPFFPQLADTTIAPLCSAVSCETADFDALFKFAEPFSFTALEEQDAEYLGLSLKQDPEMDSKQDALVAEMFAKYIDFDGGQAW